MQRFTRLAAAAVAFAVMAGGVLAIHRATRTADPAPPAAVPSKVQLDSPTVRTVGQLAAAAHVVVTGSYTALLADRSDPVVRRMSGGLPAQLWRVRVSRVIAGSVRDQRLLVLLPDGDQVADVAAPPTPGQAAMLFLHRTGSRWHDDPVHVTVALTQGDVRLDPAGNPLPPPPQAQPLTEQLDGPAAAIARRVEGAFTKSSR